jgi:hypothetical protein
MPTGVIKGNESSKKSPKELLAEITKKCNGPRYLARNASGDQNHPRN